MQVGVENKFFGLNNYKLVLFTFSLLKRNLVSNNVSTTCLHFFFDSNSWYIVPISKIWVFLDF